MNGDCPSLTAIMVSLFNTPKVPIVRASSVKYSQIKSVFATELVLVYTLPVATSKITVIIGFLVNLQLISDLAYKPPLTQSIYVNIYYIIIYLFQS